MERRFSLTSVVALQPPAGGAKSSHQVRVQPKWWLRKQVGHACQPPKLKLLMLRLLYWDSSSPAVARKQQAIAKKCPSHRKLILTSVKLRVRVRHAGQSRVFSPCN